MQEAAFNRLRANTWTTAHRQFQLVPAEANGMTWWLNRTAPREGSILVSRHSRGGECPLALPRGAVVIRELAAAALETNAMASARITGGLPLAAYRVDHGVLGGFAVSPEADDLSLAGLSETDRAELVALADSMELAAKQPQEAVAAVRWFFANNFSYRTWQPHRSDSGRSPLGVFLVETRAGHCEYFATATALLLRAANVPTRYAVGYALEERVGDLFIARERHAHAWCLAYVDGRWREVDTTPGDWQAIEAQRASLLEPLYDWFSSLWFRFAVWRQSGSPWQLYAFAAGVVALTYLGWRQLRGARWRRARREKRPARRQQQPGWDSEFYQLERKLTGSQAPRHPAESASAWANRLALSSERLRALLQEILRLHYRYRFDPRGLAGDERRRLREAVSQFLTGYERA
jgi:hypothetical protein